MFKISELYQNCPIETYQKDGKQVTTKNHKFFLKMFLGKGTENIVQAFDAQAAQKLSDYIAAGNKSVLVSADLMPTSAQKLVVQDPKKDGEMEIEYNGANIQFLIPFFQIKDFSNFQETGKATSKALAQITPKDIYNQARFIIASGQLDAEKEYDSEAEVRTDAKTNKQYLNIKYKKIIKQKEKTAPAAEAPKPTPAPTAPFKTKLR